MYNRVCLLSGQTVRPWVPWLAGMWNPYEQCDVQRMGISEGNQEKIWPYDQTACPECGQIGSIYRTAYMFDPKQACDSKVNTYASKADVPVDAPTNICYIRMRNDDSVCTHAQGMVGGGRGRSVLNHPQLPTLYGYNNVSSWPAAGLYSDSPLFRGEDYADSYGFLSVPQGEIGIVSLGLSIQPVANGLPYLRLVKASLQKQQGYMKNWQSEDVQSWVPGLANAFKARYQPPLVRKYGWDCPIRRAAYYSAAVPNFAPTFPNPARTQKLFANLTKNSSAHPTMLQQSAGPSLGPYTTSNGFCFCPAGMQAQQTQCQVSDKAHPCSLYRTVRALQGEWTPSFAFTPITPGGGPSTCQMQLDWPYLDAELRDGTSGDGDYTFASDPLNKRCHILDRLPSFQYKYMMGPVTTTATRHNTEQGGVCHTGRASKVASASATRCVKQSETADTILVTCEDGTSATLSKERSTPLSDMLTAVQSQRQKCSQCSAPPAFVNSKRQPVPAQSSFGIPFRFSASRVVAADLKEAICKTLDCSTALNHAAWGPEFMANLLSNPSALFSSAPQTPAPKKQPEAKSPFDSQWVFCNTTDALQSGACQGKADEKAWRADRFQTCYNGIRDLTHDNPNVMASVDVCLLDSDTNDLCTAVRKAQDLVKEANCLLNGSASCMLKPFLYHPSMWDVSNKEFVHSTVTSFYRRVTQDACPDPVPAIMANNQALINRCAATPVTAMYLGIQSCRDIVHAMSQVFFYSANILVDGLLLAFSSNKAVLSAQIMYYWDSIKGATKDLILSLSDIIFDALFHMGSFGGRIYILIQKSCGFINKAYSYWLFFFCGLSLDIAPAALGAIRQMVQNSELAFKVVNDALDSIFMFVVPGALSRMESMGYTTAFRDKAEEAQQLEKQNSKDSVKESVEESKSKDDVKRNKRGKVSDATKKQIGTDWKDAIAQQTSQMLLDHISDAGAAGMLLGAGLGIADQVMNAVEQKRLFDLYPENWTLFDFSPIYSALDFLEYYITNDDKCIVQRSLNFNYNESNSQILDCSFPPPDSFDSLKGALLIGTRCWTQASNDIGANNLLTCTAADTCYKSLTDRSPILCATCPDETATGISTFGCDPLTKMCTCSVPTLKSTECISNVDCYYATATCQVTTGQASYGNQPCKECSKDVQCRFSGSSVGTCSCVYQSEATQTCTQQAGQAIPITSPDKMCGLMLQADKRQAITVAHWDALALAPCSYLNPVFIICLQVFTSTNSFPMAVGLELSLTFTTGRRLLQDEDDDTNWNHTSEPCRSLAKSTRAALGPLDTQQLDACFYWRVVAKRTIDRFNLTALDDTFLLSSEDFARALMKKNALLQLMQQPQALVFAVTHHTTLKPLFAALSVLASYQIAYERPGIAYRSFRPFDNLNFTEPDKVNIDNIEPDNTDNATCGQTCRRLLSVQDDTAKFAQTWLAGPFSWPPTFYTDLNLSSCNMGLVIVQIAYDLLTVLVQYYNNALAQSQPPPMGLYNNLPTFNYNQTLNTTILGQISSFLKYNANATSMRSLTSSMIQCDFSSVTFCSKHRKELLSSIVLLFILYTILTYILRAVGLSILSTFLFLAFIPTILWYCYGMAFTCLPMVPSCLFDDLLTVLKIVLPAQISPPSSLLISPDCLQTDQASCLIKCSDPPVSFSDWRDTLAYGICTTSDSACTSLAAVIGTIDPLAAKLNATKALLATTTALDAHDFCFWITLVNLVPVLILALLALTFAGALIYIPCSLAPKLISLAISSLLHLHWDDDVPDESPQ